MSLSRKPKTINPDEIDPSVYYYDEIYDDMKNEQNQSEKQSDDKSDKPNGSKYIQGLIDTADQRKAEKELRKFKKFAKDREEAEADGGLDDADIYITPTYKRKLEEIKRLDEAKKRRVEREKDNVMNFLTKHPETEPAADNRDPGKPDTEETGITQKDDTTTEEDNESRKSENDTEQSNKCSESNIPDKPKKKSPKTRQEKKQYLREVLAKRTVGKVFEEAVQRYKIRSQSK